VPCDLTVSDATHVPIVFTFGLFTNRSKEKLSNGIGIDLINQIESSLRSVVFKLFGDNAYHGDIDLKGRS
jgi:hypothetical protein